MMISNMLLELKDKLENKNIHELRTIARVVGVSSPTERKRGSIIDDIMGIATARIDPSPRSARGAPPKSSEYDESVVNLIYECRKYFSDLKSAKVAEKGKFEVSDGAEQANCAGILDKDYLRVGYSLSCSDDIFVPESFIKRFKLKDGDYIEGTCMRTVNSTAGICAITSINGYSPDSVLRREFAELTPVYPNRRIRIVNSQRDIAARTVDMFAPVGYGQRSVISAPANSGKTTLIKQIASGICLNEEVSLIIFIVAGSPEEVTDLSRSAASAKIFRTDFGAEREEHIKTAEFLTRHCKRLVESRKDIVLIVDGLSKLGNAAKQLLASAICAEEGGSLTIIATVSSEGEYSSEYSAELLSAANMRVVLAEAAEQIPAIDPSKSYTLNCSLLQSDKEIKTAEILRKQFRQTGDLNQILNLFKQTKNNTEIVDKNG